MSLRSLAVGAVVALVAACSSTSGPVGPGSGTDNSGGGVGASSGSGSGGGTSSGGASDAAVVGDAGTCAPSDETGFTPKWHPAHAHQADCSAAQLDSLFTCLRDSQGAAPGTSPASCAPWGSNATPVNQACKQCVYTSDANAQWGAIIVHTAQNTQETNFAGCAAIAEGKLDGSGCGGQIEAYVACTNAACESNCPVDSSGNGLDALNKCLDAASQGTCSSFAKAANCLFTDAGPIAACDPTQYNDGIAAAAGIANVFCGGGTGVLPPDAGATDAATSD